MSVSKLKKTNSPSPDGEGAGGEGSCWENLFKGATPRLFRNARELRLFKKTEAEEKLWKILRNRKIENCKFRRQHPIADFIADFYCHEKKLIIEVDGGYHNIEEQKQYDRFRTILLKEFKIKVIRFTNEEIINKPGSVTEKIKQSLKKIT